MYIGLCDDNPIFLDYIYQLTLAYMSENHPYINQEPITTVSPNELAELTLNSHFPFDIFILEINLGNQNGIKIAQTINQINPDCLIIYISSHLDYVTEIYDSEHIYFILKSQIEKRLPFALKKAISYHKTNHDHRLIIHYHNKEYIIALSSIIYIESLDRYLYIYTATDKIKCIGSLKEIIHRLNSFFARCHNSYIINLYYIKSMSRTCCTISPNHTIPISQTYEKALALIFQEYVSK